MIRKPKKKKRDGGAVGKDSVGTRGVAAVEGGAGGGMASSQGRKDSGAEGKQLKTARNDSVKAQDKKKMDLSVSDVTATTSPSTDNYDSKMDTS